VAPHEPGAPVQVGEAAGRSVGPGGGHRHTGLPLAGWIPRATPGGPTLAVPGAGDTRTPGSTAIPPPPESARLPPEADAGSGGTVVVLPAQLDHSAPTPVLVAAHAHDAARERLVGAGSAVLGSLGILSGLLVALLDAQRYDQPAACRAYAAAHRGAAAFGCSGGARILAVGLPAVGLPLIVIAALALIWVPEHTARRRALLLGALLLVLLSTLAVAAAAYSATPGA